MNILQVNSCNFGSTGNIMLQTAEKARQVGHVTITACPDSRDNRKKQVEHHVFIGNRFLRNVHLKLACYTGLNGCFSYVSTWRFLRKVKKMGTQLVHLHNLHNAYLNIPLLFRYIKKNNVRVVWTFHDCWPFTGHCPYFDMVGCDKWKTGCHHCPQYKEYPASLLDNSSFMYKWKKKWFTGIKDMTIVTPSAWLAELAKESFLKDYPVQVINNGIDLDVFKPAESDFRKRYGVENKHILLGVAFGWEARKGLDVFIELANRLDKEKYQIVLVGTDEDTDKQLPENVISIHRTQNQMELAEIYTAADLFVNPTREENYPTVNMEAIACGTPVVTFRTGGSAEIVDETCGAVVEKNDLDALEREILRICEQQPFSKDACLKWAQQFDKHQRFEEYIKLYRSEL